MLQMVSQLGHLRFLTPLGKRIDFDSLEFEIGNAMAVDTASKSKPYYKFLKTGSRIGLVALQERVHLPFENGMLVVKNEDGSTRFDDRTFRFDKLIGNKIFLGPTHYNEFLDSNRASILDAENYKQRVFLGRKNFSDENAYFSNVLMINFAPLTAEADGSTGIIFSKRSDTVSTYSGFFCSLGGKVEFNPVFFNSGNKSRIAKDAIVGQLMRESQEELGLKPVSYEFKGIVDGLSGMHMHFEVKYGISGAEIIERQKSAADSWESSQLIALKNTREVLKFLLENKNQIAPIGYATGLYYLLSCGDFESLAIALKQAPKHYAVEI